MGAGYLASVDLRLPFVAMGAAMLVLLAIGLAVGGRVLYDTLQPHHVQRAKAATEVAA